MGRFRNLPATIWKEEEEEALRTAKRWRNRERTNWTDGSRLDDGRVGVVAVWWK